ncbi:30S ribosomal protein S4 [Candidatus Hydrogenosomobacter endosymbioticus]|uniref:Small ribosomal subunit protein uS4 n=1 Tax=Candidatus Hydrogenosomobacter endosymbioticus TaxID=2558174 RepID=A0ABM7V9N8_9PROT|nr:30S ribosomal protein S4 [Candidatus Hydrogenosomobacter endosymbioticus]BDB96514.1 30S ribosomal protein S4 [Candidatus Hydrogenosomobacter endosymbioticus]
MTKRLEAKYKYSRRCGVNLWGESKNPVNTRNYPPGQHGTKGAKKLTEYGQQLAAKQKLKRYYGNIGEKQFRKIYQEAVRVRGDTNENLLDLLERRLDAVVYRLKFVPSVFAARQFVNHGHVLVNGKRVDIPSYRLRDGDVVSLDENIRQNAVVASSIECKDRDVPDYISSDTKKFSGTFLRRPDPVEIPYPVQMNTALIIEFYSR